MGAMCVASLLPLPGGTMEGTCVLEPSEHVTRGKSWAELIF